MPVSARSQAQSSIVAKWRCCFGTILFLSTIFTVTCIQPGPAFAWPDMDHIPAVSSLCNDPDFQSLNATPFGTPSVYAGALIENNMHVFHELEAEGAHLHGMSHARHYYPQHGYWFGLSEKIALNDRFGILLEGWALVPKETPTHSQYVIDPFIGDIADSGVGRHWQPKTEGGFLDAAVFSSWVPGFCSRRFAYISGIRYDYYHRKLTNPESVKFQTSGVSDELDVKVQTVVLYFGTQYHQSSAVGALTWRVLVSPFIFGNLKHKESFGNGNFTDEGTFEFPFKKIYWGELFVNYHQKVMNDLDAGLFLKMTSMSLHGASSDLNTTYAGGNIESAPYSLTYRRIIYVFGVSLNWAFATPF
jgi:hypothetical protein